VNRSSLILDHYRRCWGTTPQVCNFSKGPIHQLPHGFSVVRFAPHDKRTMWTYATCCMSQIEDRKLIELHMFSPAETDDIVELMYAVAHFHCTSEKLDVGHSVYFGRPWLEKSICDYGLISLPYLDGPALEILKAYAETINFYWMIPISYSEMLFKKQQGLDALENKFQTISLDYINPSRESVV
jgi:Suppressor of fused protein (SUFU)